MSVIRFGLALFSFIFILAACSATNSTVSTIPPDSQYPADIIGTVLITNNITGTYPNSTNTFNVAPGDPANRVWWIVDVAVKNKSYNSSVSSKYNYGQPLPKGVGSNVIWSIIVDGKIWSGVDLPSQCIPPSMNLSQGQIGTTRFVFEAMRNQDPKDVQIRYAGEAPFSFGNLTESRRVAVYDWNANKVISTKLAPKTQSSVQPVEAYIMQTMVSSRVGNLKTVASWNGSSSKEITFRATTTPWVINAGYTPTSSISTKFVVTVWKGDMGTFTHTQPYGQFAGVSSSIIEDTGNYVIKVESSGCNWWVKVGTE